MVHLHNAILYNHKKEGNLTFCDSMDGPGTYYTKWNKPIRERQMPYDLTYMWSLMNKTETGMDTWNRLTAVGRNGKGGLDERREGISQRTFMHNSQVQTARWWWPERRGWGWVGAGEGQEMGTSVLVSAIKIKEKKKKVIICNCSPMWTRIFSELCK